MLLPASLRFYSKRDTFLGGIAFKGKELCVDFTF